MTPLTGGEGGDKQEGGATFELLNLQTGVDPPPLQTCP